MSIEIVPVSTAKYSTTDHKSYTGVNCNTDSLDAGVYRCSIGYNGEIFFNKVENGKSEMLKFPSEQQTEVIEEIKEFWSKREDYKKMGLTYKRGVLLYGPQGSGKTSVINILIKDIIARNGVIIDFKHHKTDIPCIQFFRKAEPERPLMIIMEDIDALFSSGGDNHESAILNLLDGIFQIDNVVFLATTNYPEKLAERITDRPSRFDRVVQVGLPLDSDRKFYLEHLVNKMDIKPNNFNIEQWVKDTKDLSVAHLKELVISVMLYGKDYKMSLHKLDAMKHPLKASGRKKKVGFGADA